MKQEDGRDEGFLGLFELVTQPSGEITAEFTPLTAPIELNLRWKLKSGEDALARVLLLLSTGSIPFPPVELPTPVIKLLGSSNTHAIHRAGEKLQSHNLIIEKLILTPLAESFGEDVAILVNRDNPSETRTKARKKLQRRFENVLDAIENKQSRTSHAHASVIECQFEGSGPHPMPVAWVALQVTRQLVEKNQALPTKGKVRLELASQYPASVELTKRKWTNIWIDAGLKSLPRSTAWELEKLKRAIKTHRGTKKG